MADTQDTAQNPLATDAPHKQTEAAGGGVSSAANVQSPVPSSDNNLEQTNSQGGIVDTVKSYLGYGSGTGTQASETGQLGTSGTTKNAEDTTSGSGSGAGITGAAATAASAVGLGSGNQAAGGGIGSTSADSATTGNESSTSTAGGSTLEAAKEKVQEVTNTQKEDTSGDNGHKPPQAAGGKPKQMENPSAIPIAGGEKLGEKHWGESKIVPDNPETRASQANISSEEGQPTKQATDNTAANTGGATGPPGSEGTPTSGSGSGSGNGSGEKPKTMDKIKDKLHIGKKE